MIKKCSHVFALFYTRQGAKTGHPPEMVKNQPASNCFLQPTSTLILTDASFFKLCILGMFLNVKKVTALEFEEIKNEMRAPPARFVGVSDFFS